MPALSMQTHALDHLQYIRQTMQRAAPATAVPGWGGVAMGLTALAAGGLAQRALPDLQRWLTIWIIEAAVAFLVGGTAMVWKMRQAGSSPLSPAGRRFAAGFTPPVLAGALLTVALCRAGVFSMLPGTWLALYGLSILGGGAYAVRLIPILGVCFLLLGGVTLFLPFPLASALLGSAFGLLHVAFGYRIARRHGG